MLSTLIKAWQSWFWDTISFLVFVSSAAPLLFLGSSSFLQRLIAFVSSRTLSLSFSLIENVWTSSKKLPIAHNIYFKLRKMLFVSYLKQWCLFLCWYQILGRWVIFLDVVFVLLFFCYLWCDNLFELLQDSPVIASRMVFLFVFIPYFMRNKYLLF